jgi:heme/copper-type cytochrome/quinol oxidase subunit 2
LDWEQPLLRPQGAAPAQREMGSLISSCQIVSFDIVIVVIVVILFTSFLFTSFFHSLGSTF